MNPQPQILGRTSGGADIEMFVHGKGSLPVLLIGGVHGDESEGYLFAERLHRELVQGSIPTPDGVTLYLVPRMNPDGCQANRRTNHRNVDLNRNLPTRDWDGKFQNVRYYPGSSAGSEVESRVTVELIEKTNPAFILSLHSYENPMVNYNGESLDVAAAMSKINGLPAKGDIGYPTPGSLGTYAGWERNIPTITLEILRGENPDSVWNNHLSGVLAGITYYVHNTLPSRKEPGGT